MNKKKLFRIKDFITPTTLLNGERKLGGVKLYIQIKDLYVKRSVTQKRQVLPSSKANKRFRCELSNIVPNVFWYSTCGTNYTIVRPLMNCLRGDITMTCTLSLLPVYPDLSNLKMRYSRNRIRKQIIPTIKFFLNPKIEKSLLKFSEFYNKEISLSIT